MTSREGHAAIDDGSLVAGGRYRIDEEIAKGAMCLVYRATDVATGRAVALKVLGGKYARRDDARPRLFAEQRYSSLFAGHPMIVAALGHGELPEHDSAPYLALEYVDGPTLSGYLRSRGDDTALRLQLLRDLAGVVSVVHAAGVVHRDIKPRNIMVATVEGSPVPKLTDFGLATRVEGADPADERLTREHDRPGTKHYMAPEQCLGMPPTRAADVYALGITAYEMLVGEPPWASRAEIEVVHRKCDATLPPFSLADLSLDVPACVVDAIDRALQFDPGARPTAAELRDAAAQGLREVSLAKPGRTALLAVVVKDGGVAARGGLAPVLPIRPVQEVPPAAVEFAVPTAVASAPSRPERSARQRGPWWWALPVVAVGGVLASVAIGGALEDPAARSVVTRGHDETAPAAAGVVTDPAAPAPVVVGAEAPATAPAAMPAAAPTARPTLPSPGKAKSKRPAVVPPTAAAPSDVAETSECMRRRADAEAADLRGDADAVVQALQRKECWADKRAHRRALVAALADSGAYARCVAAGRGSGDPNVQALVDLCESRRSSPTETP